MVKKMKMVGLVLQIVAIAYVINMAEAAKYNLTRVENITYIVSHDPPDANCGVPGICSPLNVTIPARTFWYWCGFMTTHRTIYSVSSVAKGINISAIYMMRKHVVENCVLPNVTFVAENCVAIPESSCSSKSSCNVRLFGLVFPDEECFVIINNKGSALPVTVRINNYFDSPRYLGTVFVLIFTIFGGLAIIANVAWQFYTIIIAPITKQHHPVKVKRDETIEKPDVESESAPITTTVDGAANGVASRAIGWYQKIMRKLRPERVYSGHVA